MEIFSRNKTQWALALFASAVTFISFYPALNAQFINWDDDVNILLNKDFQGLGLAQLKWMWTTVHMGPYQPLTWLSWSIDYLVWGLKPFGYHFGNVLLHSINAAIFFALARLLLSHAFKGSKDNNLDLAALVSALLFSIHPLRVESVAWVTERRDVLSGLFYLSSLVFYVQGRVIPSYVLFTAGLLSKAIGVTIPAMLVALDVFPLGRLPHKISHWPNREYWPLWREKIPFFMIALFLGIFGAIAQNKVGATLSVADFGILPRIAQASFGQIFYLWKTIWPVNLIPLYEARNPVIWQWPFLPSVITAIGLNIAAIVAYFFWPAFSVLWLCYILGLLPVLGFIKFGQYVAADRYTYLACLSWAVSGGAALLWSLARLDRSKRSMVLALAGTICSALGYLTWKQSERWYDSESLWSYTITVYPALEFAQNNLGTALAEKGRFAEAIPHYIETIKINPWGKNAHFNLGNALYKLGHRKDAILAYRAALKCDANYAEAHHNLAIVLSEEGQLAEAMTHMGGDAKSAENLSQMHNNQGIMLTQQGHKNEAVAEFREAIKINPKNAAAFANMGSSLSDLGQAKEAFAALKTAESLDPKNPEIQNSWGTALIKSGDYAGAKVRFLSAIKLNPNLPDAHNNVAVILTQEKQFDLALEHYRKALSLRQDYPEAHFGMGNILATLGKWEEAAGHYRETLRLQPNNDAARKNLELVTARINK